MSHEVLVKRTIYVAKCGCGRSYHITVNPPLERMCKCGRWVKFEEMSFTGPDLRKAGR